MPDSAEFDFRQAKRVKVHRWAYFEWKGRDCKGLAYDLSTKGARILTGKAGSFDLPSPDLSPGDRLRLRFELGADEEPVGIDTEVVRLTDDGFAVEFIDADAENASSVRDLVARAQSDPRVE